MKNVLLFLLIFLCYGAVITSISSAQDSVILSPVAQKTKEMVDATHAYISIHSDDMMMVQSALEKDPRFSDHNRNLYIFMHCYDVEKKSAICCGHGVRPELVGKQMGQLRTPNGRLIFQEIIQMIENQGQGWIEYDWLNPYTRKLETKASYMKGIVLKDGRKAWIGSGFWQ